jgi:hypothetical protein
MKSPLSILIFALTALATLASGLKLAQKSVVFSYPAATPQHVVNAAMEAIVEAGGMITHEYKIFKLVAHPACFEVALLLTCWVRRGFAATIPPKSIEMVSSLSVEFKPMVEEDEIVGILE